MQITPKTILFLLLSVSLLLVLCLYLLSDKKINYKYQSFDRIFKSKFINFKNSCNLQTSHSYFASIPSNKIYLGNHNSPFKLFCIDTSFTQKKQISIPFEDSLAFRTIRVMIDSPFFYVLDGTIPFMYRGLLNKPIAINYMKYPIYFVDAVPISHHSFAFRSSVKGEYELLKKNIHSPDVMIHNLLERQTDGLLEKSGMLHYDKEFNKLVYLYSYRNQYIVSDSNFNLLHKNHTIDTISRVKIKTAKITSEKVTTLTVPPLVVNLMSALSGQYLYVNSNIPARNEMEPDFESNSVIDVYDTSQGKYLYSFYIPNRQGKKMKSFRVSNNESIYVIYERELVKYSLQ